MTEAPQPQPQPDPSGGERRSSSRGVGVTNWLVAKTAGLLERKTSRRGFLVGTAMAGSAVAVAGCLPLTRPGPPYTHITDCASGLCTDGWTEFCCTINDGVNACPPDSFWGGWWRADYSSFCNGTRYYIDCMEYCCGPATGYQNFCAGCQECRCAKGCDTRHVYCNYFRYGQCHTDIVASGPITCRVVTCVPPYAIDPACSTATLVDNATAEHTSPCITSPRPPASLPTSAPGGDVARRRRHARLLSPEQRHASAPGRGRPDGTAGPRRAPRSSARRRSRRRSPPRATVHQWFLQSEQLRVSPAAPTVCTGPDGYNRFDGTTWIGTRPHTRWRPPGRRWWDCRVEPLRRRVARRRLPVRPDGRNRLCHRHFDAACGRAGTRCRARGPRHRRRGPSAGIFVFARGTDDGVDYRRLSGGAWSGWTSLVGQTSAAPRSRSTHRACISSSAPRPTCGPAVERRHLRELGAPRRQRRWNAGRRRRRRPACTRSCAPAAMPAPG